MYIYIFMYICIYTYTYIYIYIDRWSLFFPWRLPSPLFFLIAYFISILVWYYICAYVHATCLVRFWNGSVMHDMQYSYTFWLFHKCSVSRQPLRLNETSAHCKILQHAATHCNTPQHTVTHYSTLHHTTKHYNTPQHTATQTRRQLQFHVSCHVCMFCILAYKRIAARP